MPHQVRKGLQYEHHSRISFFKPRHYRNLMGGGRTFRFFLGGKIVVLSTLLGSTNAWRLPPRLHTPLAHFETLSTSSAIDVHSFPSSVASRLGSAISGRFLESVLLLLPLTVLPPSACAFPGLEDCTSESNPSFTIVTCDRFGIDPVAGRPKRCLSAENCISSTSVNNPSKYMSPWVFNGAGEDVPTAWLSLVRAVEAQEGLKVVEIDNGSKQYYLRAEAPSKVPPGGVDDLEFLLSPKDGLVFFRSASRQMAFLYPLTQPVGDGGSIKKRLETIQKAVGWSTVEEFYDYK